MNFDTEFELQMFVRFQIRHCHICGSLRTKMSIEAAEKSYENAESAVAKVEVSARVAEGSLRFARRGFPVSIRRATRETTNCTDGRAIITMRIDSSADRLRRAQEESRILRRRTLDDAVSSVSVSLMIKLCTEQIRRIDAVDETTLKVCLCRKERLLRWISRFFVRLIRRSRPRLESSPNA